MEYCKIMINYLMILNELFINLVYFLNLLFSTCKKYEKITFLISLHFPSYTNFSKKISLLFSGIIRHLKINHEYFLPRFPSGKFPGLHWSRPSSLAWSRTSTVSNSVLCFHIFSLHWYSRKCLPNTCFCSVWKVSL